MIVTITYEVSDKWAEEQQFNSVQVGTNLIGAARQGFNACYGGLGTRGTDFIKLLRVNVKDRDAKDDR